MELEIFEAFRAAGVPDDKARGVVVAISDLIDRRYALHADQLATRGDVASGRAELERVTGELTASIAGLRGELTASIAGLRGELTASIASVRTERTSSTTAKAATNTRRLAGMREPKSARMPSAKAMSVAVGTDQPDAVRAGLRSK